jgi:hypothetical protein
MRFAVMGQLPILEVAREDGLDLLAWLGLGRGEFGAVEGRILLPLCRRRLWPELRNVDPARSTGARSRAAGTLRRLTGELASAIDSSPDGLVHFG